MQRLCHVYLSESKVPMDKRLERNKTLLAFRPNAFAGSTEVHVFVTAGATLHKNEVCG
jgi:hypothetical protein